MLSSFSGQRERAPISCARCLLHRRGASTYPSLGVTDLHDAGAIDHQYCVSACSSHSVLRSDRRKTFHRLGTTAIVMKVSTRRRHQNATTRNNWRYQTNNHRAPPFHPLLALGILTPCYQSNRKEDCIPDFWLEDHLQGGKWICGVDCEADFEFSRSGVCTFRLMFPISLWRTYNWNCCSKSLSVPSFKVCISRCTCTCMWLRPFGGSIRPCLVAG